MCIIIGDKDEEYFTWGCIGFVGYLLVCKFWYMLLLFVNYILDELTDGLTSDITDSQPNIFFFEFDLLLSLPNLD